MATRRSRRGLWICAGVCLAMVQLAARAQIASAQEIPDAPRPAVHLLADRRDDSHIQPRQLSGDFPDKPSLAPTWTIPVEGLGFAAPGALYLGERNSLASLGFLDENHLLFTFRVPALLRREPGDEGEEREIRAVVLSLPGGTVEAEDHWLVHDRARYLWMLRGGHFLLRDRNRLTEGDASLKLTPLLDFPGPLLSIGLTPSQDLLVADSREPAHPEGKAGSGSETWQSNIDTGDTEPIPTPDVVLRILRRDSGQVMLVTRMREVVHVPIDDEGFLDSRRGNGVDWRVEMNLFAGGTRPLGNVKSACRPRLDFVSEHEVLAMACADMGDNALVAMTTEGRKLWIDLVPDRQIWPVLTVAANGLRIARESLYVSHGIDNFAPLEDQDIKGQWLQVLDSATGNIVFETPLRPILDAGGNVALSPSGRRIAIVNNGDLEIFKLPQAPEVPAP